MLNTQQIGNPITLLVFLIILILNGCDPYKDVKIVYNGNVQITVCDRSTGEPVPEAVIHAETDDYYTYYDETSYWQYIEWENNSITDENGTCLIRNLPVGSFLTDSSLYRFYTTKFPGYNQDVTLVTPQGLKTIHVDILLDSADAQFSVSPLSLHFQSGQTRESLVITNEDHKTLYWELGYDMWLFSCEPWNGVLSAYSSQTIVIDVDRDQIDTFPAETTISMGILSTGEIRMVDVTIEENQ